jgi:hypothetical protein
VRQKKEEQQAKNARRAEFIIAFVTRRTKFHYPKEKHFRHVLWTMVIPPHGFSDEQPNPCTGTG